MRNNVIATGLLLLSLCLAPQLSWGSVETDMNQAVKHKATGDSYLKHNKSELAIDEYEKALRFHPKLTATHFNLAIAYFLEKKMHQAISTLEALVELNPKDVEAWYNLASLELYRGDWEKAAIFFEKAQSCCEQDHSFIPLIDQGLAFIKELSSVDPHTRSLTLFALQLEHDTNPVSVIL